MATFPLLKHYVAFNADPSDPIGVPVWVDLGDKVTSISDIARGRQYELDRTRVEDSKITFFDPNEDLNTLNTASPYYPYVQPYRQLLHLAAWRTGLGAAGNVQTGNLLNLSNWRVPADPSFESYALGITPDWITVQNVGAVTSTTNPQAGSQCLLGTVAGSTTRQGLSFDVPCIPGSQYTTSVYVRQAGASTQEIRVIDQTAVADNFNRTTASGWGTPASPGTEIGGTWTATNGTAGERATVAATPYAPAYATIAPAGTATARYQTQGSLRDVRQRMRLRAPVVATGSWYSLGAVARYADASNHYFAEVRFDTDQSVTLRVSKRVAGADTLLGSAVTLDGVRYQAGDEFFLDFYVTGQNLQANLWRTSDLAPVTNGLTGSWLISTTDTAITAAGAVGCRALLNTGNTNTTPALAFLTYSAVGSTLGSTTTTTGSYVRLSVTWTATQPTHTVSLSTTGTAVAGAVNYDSFQHEQAAAASAFGTAGAVIYPLDRMLIERWPRQWWAAGRAGFADTLAVSPLAALSAVGLPSEYDYAVRALSPDYFWALDGGSGTTVYADSTGNGNPPLEWDISKYGVGTVPEGGGSLAIPGGAGATGVTFTAPSPATGVKLAATALGAGPTIGTGAAPVNLPESIAGVGGIWRMTVAIAVSGIQSTGAGQTGFTAIRTVSSTSGYGYMPISVSITGSVSFNNYVPSTGAVPSLSSGSGLSGITVTDGQPHLIVGIVVQDAAGDTSVYKFVDDELDGVATATTASLGGVLGAQSDSVIVGAFDDGYQFAAVADGVIGKVAVWNRELDPSETLGLRQAWLGYAGEDSPARVDRHLTQAGWTGARRVSGALTVYADGDPVSLMGAPSWTGVISALGDLANTQQAEQGTFWADADGAIVTETREDRFLRLTSSWTFGEQEYPYLGDIKFDHDPTYVYADVTITRSNGGTGVGGTPALRAEATRRFFPRSFPLSVDLYADEQAQDMADFIFYSHRAPNPRVEKVSFNPAANPALWPMVLGARLGDRVTVVRRAAAANGGAGITITKDFFIERIAHREINFQTGTWFTDMWLSPIGTAPGPTVQPWILGDTTYSVLGSTTVLGW